MDKRRIMDVRPNIRNVSVIGHASHGKSTLINALLAAAAPNVAGDVPRLDTRNDEVERGITIKSTGMSLYYNVPDDFLKNFKGRRIGNEYLINLVNSPGHSDLSSEVTAALRITDGALVIVDCIDGVSMHTETVLRQAIGERVLPVLVVNKMDKCFLELQVDGEEAYQMILRVIEKVNAVMGTYEDHLLGDIQVCPGKGTVAFAAGSDGWAFSLIDFAKLYASKFRVDETKFTERLWGENFFDPCTKKWTKYKTGSASCKRGFVLFCYEPIKQIMNACMNNEKENLLHMLEKLRVSMNTKEKELTGKSLMKFVMNKWLPSSSALLRMMIYHLPSPETAQKYRVENLYEGELDDQYANAIRNCDPEGPLMVYVSKMIPESNKGKGKGKFFAIGRVFSGKVSAGLEVRIMGPNYTPGETKDLYVQGITRTVIWMGNKLETVDDVPCGNIVAMLGLDQFITKNATLTNEMEVGSNRIRAMNFSVSPIMQVAVQCKNPLDLPKLVKGLKQLSKSDPVVVCSIMESGAHTIACAGELHLEICLKDLQDNFMDGAEITKDEPLVSYCETVLENSSHRVMSMSANKHNRIFMEARPLEEGLAEAIDEREIGDSKGRSRIVSESFGWGKGYAAKRLWCFGPDNIGPNVIVDMSKGSQYLNEIKDSVVAGFQIASNEGALAGEKLRGVCFQVRDVSLHPDGIHRGRGQIIQTAQRAMYASQLTAKPRLLEPVYQVEIQGPEEAVGDIYKLLYQQRGQVSNVVQKLGTQSCITAYLPGDGIFRFAGALRDASAGHIVPQFDFHHWDVLLSDPLEAGSVAADICARVRKSKGLKVNISPVSEFEDTM